MKSAVDKSNRDAGIRMSENQSTREKSRGATTRHFVDNSPQGNRAAQLRAMIDNSPRLVSQRQQAERVFNGTAQRQEVPAEGEIQMKAGTSAVQLQGLEDEELMQGKFEPAQRQGIEDEELLQGKFATGAAPTQLQGEDGPRENRTGMPDQLKSGIENLSGMSLDGVQVHYNSAKPAALQALAYTQGSEIHVGPGQEQHLAHEAWHVVQQRQGRVNPTISLKGTDVNDDPRLEQEADLMGLKATQTKA